MTRQRADEPSAEERDPIELILGEHTLILAFAALCIFAVFLVYLYFGRTLLAQANIPEPAPLIAIVDDDGQAIPTMLQRHTNSRGPTRIGIIAGHHGSDSGAVCDLGGTGQLQEVSITLDIANRVVDGLKTRGIDAQLLEEYDSRLAPSYDARAVVSLHVDSCVDNNGQFLDLSGFKSAPSTASGSDILQTCIDETYMVGTQLPYNSNTITNHMREYHAFGRLGPSMPALILEMGFMSSDRDLLTNRADVPAAAIVDGILCFVERSQ